MLALRDYLSERGIVAIAALGVLGFLIYCGHDGTILVMLNTIIVWYFSQSKEEKVQVRLSDEQLDRIYQNIEKYIDKKLE